MLDDEPRQRRARTLPVVARLERIDGRGREQLAGRVDDRDLAAGPDAGVETEHRLRTGRRRQQQLMEIAAEYLDRLGLRGFAQLHQQLDRQVQMDFDLPRPFAHAVQPRVGAAAAVLDPDLRRDHRDAGMRRRRLARIVEPELDLQHSERAATEQRQRAMRRDRADGLGIGVVVAELLLFGELLALRHRGAQDAVVPQARTHGGEQLRGLREALGQDVARAVERRFRVRHVDRLDAFRGRSHEHVLGRFRVGIERRIGEQRVGERLQPGLARDLRPGAALRLVREVKILERLLGRRHQNRGAQLVGQLPLLLDRRQDRRAPLFELAQIQQALLQRTQLRIVEVAGHLFSIARDERHARAFVEQRDGGGDLMGADAELMGEGGDDLRSCGVGGHSRCPIMLAKRGDGVPLTTTLRRHRLVLDHQSQRASLRAISAAAYSSALMSMRIDHRTNQKRSK